MNFFQKPLDMYRVTRYNICNVIQKEVRIIAKSRADYMKSRREGKKNFSVLVDKEKMEDLEQKLKSENKTKVAWLEEKIDEELKK